MLCRNFCYLRYFHGSLKDFKMILNSMSPNKCTSLAKQTIANICSCQGSEISSDSKNKESKSRFKKFDNFTKIMNSHHNGWSMSKVLTSFHIEMPKHIPNLLDCLVKELEKRNIMSFQKDDVKSLEPGKALLKTENIESMLKHEESGQAIQNKLGSDLKDLTSPNIEHISSTFQNDFKDPKIEPKVDDQQSITLKDQMVTSASGALSSTVNAVLNFSNYFGIYWKMEDAGKKYKVKTETTKTGQVVMRVFSEVPDLETIERRTRYLVYRLRTDDSDGCRVEMLCELSDYFVNFSKMRSVAMEGKIVPCLLRLRETKKISLRQEVHKALALIGYVAPLQSKGVRILALDGGGMRGLISLEILKQLEQRTNKRVHELFDYVCGVSTGSLIGTLTCVFKLTLEEAEDVYMKVSKKIFERNKVYGAGTLVWDSAFYDTKIWQRELISRLGEKSFMDVMGDPTCPKNFLFRNYNFHPSQKSSYLGSVEHKFWEATRASSAAPWYFEEFKLHNYIHQDGGLLTNNPTGIAIQESRLIWSKEDIHCVISLGTGKHRCPLNEPKLALKSSFKDKISKIVESATDTEAVHAILKDALPPSTYFRFNPPTSEIFGLDEISETKWIQMRRDAIKYCHNNQDELDKAAKQLLVPKNPFRVAKDWVAEKMMTHL